MSRVHKPVSASVIKSTSRFAPKAVPRKKQPATTPKTAATHVETTEDGEESVSEPQIEQPESSQIPSGNMLVDSWIDDVGTQVSGDGVPPIQASVPVSMPEPPGTVPATHLITTQSTSTSAEGIQVEANTSSQPAVAAAQPRKRKSQSAPDNAAPSVPRRRKSKGADSAAENATVATSTVTMSEMCIDKRTGRKSSRYAELREAERQRRRLRQLKRDQQNNPDAEVETQQIEETQVEEEDDTLVPVTAGTARVMTDSNGNIILDNSSLQVDRHAVHPATLTDTLVHTTETVFSSKTNSSTYASARMHASNNVRWLPEENERFYIGLSMFGTDFTLIATYLGGDKSRRHVKNKFDREEKKNPDKITLALKNRLAVDMAEMEAKGAVKLRSREELQAELALIKEDGRTVMALPNLSQLQGGNDGEIRESTIADAVYGDS